MEEDACMLDDAREDYDDVASTLTATSSARGSKMFGMPCLKIGGKVFAGRSKEGMVFKLHGEAHAQALALSGARLFDPMGHGRPMREWVEVPLEHASRWLEVGREALAYVEGTA
jgi:hypothetical protein